MNKIALIALAAAVAVGVWIAVAGNGGESGGSALVGRAFYACDGGKTISAAFYGRPDGKLGTVEVSLDGAASTTLARRSPRAASATRRRTSLSSSGARGRKPSS